MTIKEYQTQTGRTNAPLTDTYNDLTSIHMLMGMMTEVGELTDQFKKHLAYGKDIDWVNVKEEIGDLMWYISEFANQHQFDLEEILETNIAKLQKRFPEKFTSEHAIHRNLNAEREILSKNISDLVPFYTICGCNECGCGKRDKMIPNPLKYSYNVL